MKKFILLFFCSFLVGQTEISMVSTSNVFAEYYDCGCPNNPLGGIARKAHFINTMMKGKDPIILDAGNMLFDSNEVNPDKLSLENKQYKAENLVKTMELLDHDIMNIGSNDFKGGLDFLKNISSRTTIKFVSANLYDKNGKLLFDPYHVVSSKGLNVGIVGLSEATRSNSVIDNKDFVSEGNKNIDKIIDSVDILVLLIDISDDNSIDLAKAFSRADYIFLSGVKYRTESKTVQGQDGPLIYAGGIQGKHLSIVDLSLKDSKTAINDASPSFYRMLVIKDRLDKYQRKDPSKTLKQIYANQPGMLELIGNYITEFNEIKKSLEQEYDNRNLFSSIPMYKSMPEDKKVAAFIDKIAHGANFTFHEDEHQH